MSKPFHGLSSPDELREGLNNLLDGLKIKPYYLDIVFEYSNVNQIINAFTQDRSFVIINILHRYRPNQTGHYVMIFRFKNLLFYFDPLGGIPDERLLNDLIKVCDAYNLELRISQDGKQKINQNSCGWWCLFEVYKVIVDDTVKFVKTLSNKDVMKKDILSKLLREQEIIKGVMPNNEAQRLVTPS